MPKATLSAEYVRSVPIPDKGKVDHYDTAITGLILEVRATGGKTYYLRFRDPHGKQRQHKIGDAQSISFDKAKNAAQMLRSRVVLGESPAEERKVKRTIPTIKAYAAETYMPFVKGYKKSWHTDDAYLRNHVLPKFGSCHLDELTQEDVAAYHRSMRAKGYAAATANHVVVLISYMYTVAKKFKVAGADTNPASGIPMFEPVSRERYLSSEETQRLKLAIEHSKNPQLKYIVAMLILTGARKRELLDSRWEDFDLERKSWRIAMTKNGKPRHVPLSASALSVLAQVPRWDDCPYVLPNPQTKKPIVSFHMAWDTARKQAGLPEVRCHDLRHSFASFC